AEATRRIEQAVAAVVTQARGQRGAEERARVLEAGRIEQPRRVGREQLGARGPGPFLLPDEIALPLDIPGEEDGACLVGIVFLVQARSLQSQQLVSPQKIAAE